MAPGVVDYRVLYDIDDAKQTITIVHVGQRQDVYREVSMARTHRHTEY